MKKILYLAFLIASFLPTHAQTTAEKRCAAFGKGMNISNWLEAGWQAGWPTANGYTKQDLINMKQAGIQSLRLPVCFARIVDTLPPYNVDTNHVLFARIDTVIQWANELQMNVIIDNHHEWLLDATWRNNQFRLAHLWSVVAQRYAYLDPNRFTFELLNEPTYTFPLDSLNILFNTAIDSIRQHTTVHSIIVCPNLGSDGLAFQTYTPLADTNLIYTWHCYNPLNFTHQGFTWNDPVYPTGTIFPNQTTTIYEQLLYQGVNSVIQWKDSFNKPVFLGEFGVGENGDAVSRCNWIEYIAQNTSAHKMPWFYWDWRWDFSMFYSHVVSSDSIIPCFSHALRLYGDTLHTGVSDLANNSLEVNIFPNPMASGSTFYISVKDVQPFTCQITDNTGRIVLPAMVMQQSGSLPLDVEKGMYFIRLTIGDKTVVRKLICD